MTELTLIRRLTMKTLLATLLLTSVCYAGTIHPKMEYDYLTGGITMRDLPEKATRVAIVIQAQYSLAPSYYDPDIEYSEWRNRHLPIYRPGFTPIMNWIQWEHWDLPTEMFLGYLLEPEIDFSDEGVSVQIDSAVYGFTSWSHFQLLQVGEPAKYYSMTTVNQPVPEPCTLALGVMFGFCYFLWLRRVR